jgi:hypothetical protein
VEEHFYRLRVAMSVRGREVEIDALDAEQRHHTGGPCVLGSRAYVRVGSFKPTPHRGFACQGPAFTYRSSRTMWVPG